MSAGTLKHIMEIVNVFKLWNGPIFWTSPITAITGLLVVFAAWEQSNTATLASEQTCSSSHQLQCCFLAQCPPSAPSHTKHMCISSFFSVTPKSVEEVYELTCQTILGLLKPVRYQNIPLLRSCTAEVIAKILTMPPATGSRGIFHPAYCDLLFFQHFCGWQCPTNGGKGGK